MTNEANSLKADAPTFAKFAGVALTGAGIAAWKQTKNIALGGSIAAAGMSMTFFSGIWGVEKHHAYEKPDTPDNGARDPNA